MTKMAKRLHSTVNGMVTDLSSMSILIRLALPDKVAVLFASSQYFCTINITNVMHSRTTAMADAPSLS